MTLPFAISLDKIFRSLIIKNRKEALEYVIKNAIKGDIILLVGKGHENYQIKNGKRIPFSEKQVIFELLGKGDTEV